MFKETEEWEPKQLSSYLVSSIYTEPSSAVNVTCIVGYESSCFFFPPKKVYIIDCKTADVRVIFLFKELSHIL